MIDILVSNSCKHCVTQLDNMKKSFFDNEYRIINVGSKEFDSYDLRGDVDGVPFVVVRDEAGKIKYARGGVHDGTELRKIERRQPAEPFNLRLAKAAK